VRAGFQFAAGQHLDLVGTALGDGFVQLADSGVLDPNGLGDGSDTAEVF
jgi:hypothetical protein